MYICFYSKVFFVVILFIFFAGWLVGLFRKPQVFIVVKMCHVLVCAGKRKRFSRRTWGFCHKHEKLDDGNVTTCEKERKQNIGSKQKKKKLKKVEKAGEGKE